MAEHSTIEWTDATWNPITGCSIVSPGCTNCYAMKLAGTRLKNHPTRAGLTKPSKAGPVWTGEVRFNEKALLEPLKWKRSRMIFVCAHGDLFHESVPDEWIDKVFAVMALCPQHTFQVLTKRSARMQAYCASKMAPHRQWHWMVAFNPARDDVYRREPFIPTWPLPNVWLGVSAERQQEADARVPDLLATPAAVRFVSLEPLLGPIDLRNHRVCDQCDMSPARLWRGDPSADPSIIWDDWKCPLHYDPSGGCDGVLKSGLDWVIVGGESQHGSRPMHPDWARSLRDQCVAAGVPFFFKQWGDWWPVCEMSDTDINRVYRSNRLAKSNESQDALDDCYGRTCTVETLCLRHDGLHCDPNGRNAFLAGTGAMLAFRVGKKAAGRLLDGIEHNGMPGRGFLDDAAPQRLPEPAGAV